MTTSRILASLALSALLSCGTNGSNGTAGPTGLPGPEGPAGPAGAMGDKGDPGAMGAMGNMGATGPSGQGTSDIPLPGVGYYPESLTTLANGTLFVGSLLTGEVWKYVPGSPAVTKFLAADTAHKNVTGVLADEANGYLYICGFDNADNTKGAVLRYKLADATLDKTYPLGTTGTTMSACNDMTFDGMGNLFVTDSLGSIYQLAAGGTAMTQWAMDTTLQPMAGSNYGVDGIAYDGAGHLFTTNISKGTIVRLAITAGTGAVGAIDVITPTPALTNPDALRFVDATHYLVVEGGDSTKSIPGKLTKLTIDNTAKTAAGITIDNRLDAPTSVVAVGGNYWITEGQIPQLFTAMPNPNLPFYVRRLPIFN